MDIIETVRSLLEAFPKISDIAGEVHVDFTSDEPTSYGLSSAGDMLLSEDILGNQTRQHSFLLYTTYCGINDYERMANSTALAQLAVWLDAQRGNTVTTEIDGTEYTGELVSVSASNGMLYAVPQENVISGIQYQLQITAQYTVDFI